MLEEASQYIAKENLYLSHQCGFASCDVGMNYPKRNSGKKLNKARKLPTNSSVNKITSQAPANLFWRIIVRGYQGS